MTDIATGRTFGADDTLSEAIRRLRAALDGFSTIKRFPDIPPTRKVVQALGAAEGPARVPEASFLETVRANLLAASQTLEGIAGAERRDLRHAPWLLWSGKPPLASLDGLVDMIAMLAETSRSVRRGFIEAWLAAAASAGPKLVEAGHAIRLLLQKVDDARLDLWRQAERRYGFFDLARGPAAVARDILTGSRPVAEILASVGLDEPARAVGGYVRQVQAGLLSQLPDRLSAAEAGSAFERATAFLAPDNRLRFQDPQTIGAVAAALLTPWISKGFQPPEAIRSRVQAFLLRTLGDPRTKPDRWTWAGPDAVRLMRGWLARASLAAFFDVIADHAEESFKYRRKFWSAYLERQAISDAWIALGRHVHDAAGAIRDLDGAYARMKGVNGDKSLLMLKIGSTVYCEWSHAGKLRAWPDDWKNAPNLYESEYAQVEVAGKGLPFPSSGGTNGTDGRGLSHINSDAGYWQTSAAELIAQRGGPKLGPKDWMPK